MFQSSPPILLHSPQYPQGFAPSFELWVDDVEGIEVLRWEDQQKIRKYVESAAVANSTAAANVECVVEVAPTARATCRTCNQKIAKGEESLASTTCLFEAHPLYSYWYCGKYKQTVFIITLIVFVIMKQLLISGDKNFDVTIVNVLNSLPFIAIGLQAPRKNVNCRIYANSLIGVGVASSIYHVSRGRMGKYLRWADYTMIATATVVGEIICRFEKKGFALKVEVGLEDVD